MPIADSAQRREAIREALAQRAGATRDSRAVGETALAIWREMSARLAPVIGTRGGDVLFRRALHLTSSAFPLLSSADIGLDGDAPLERVAARLAAAERASAAEAACALLLTFVELLESLIGESLTGRLLDPVWAPPPPSESEEGNPQ
jgi:hypothetical protein